MILPGSYLFSLILLILSMLCLGSWANTLKLAGPKWRFELYYNDFALGALIAALLAAFTFGSLGLDGFTVMDDLRLAGRRQEAYAFLAGCVFNLGNMLLVAAISLAGLSLAIPVGLGMAMIAGALIGHFVNPMAGGGLLLTAGCGAVLAGIGFDAVAARRFASMKAAAAHAAAMAAAALAAEQAAAQNKPAAPVKKKSRRRPATAKALFLAIIGGILIAASSPLLDFAREGENGLGPYSTALIATVGIVFSTFVYNLFFMNLPVQGAAVDFSQYFAGGAREHLLGLAGGMAWLGGALFVMVAVRAEGAAKVGQALNFGLQQGAMVIGALWGLTLWKEFDGAEGNIRLYLGVTFLLLVLGIIVASLAPLYGAH